MKFLYTILSFAFLSTTLFFPLSAHAIRENMIIRVGYVDYAKLVQKCDQDGEIQKQVDNVRSSYKQKIEDLTKEVQDLQQDISTNPSTDSIRSKTQELEKKSLDLSLLKIRSIQDIQKITSSALQKINDKIKPVIQNIAKKQHFDIIIDSSLVLIANPALDITSFVLASL